MAPTPIAGSDRARPAVDAARRNAERAGVSVPLAVVEAAHARPPAEAGLLVCNPPYGRRAAAARHAFERLAQALAGPFAGWRAAVLCPERALEPLLGRPVEARLPLRSCGVRVQLLLLPRCVGGADGR